MGIFSAGFAGRRDRDTAADVPPGQYVTHDFPVLSAGATPRIPLDEWRLELGGDQGVVRTWVSSRCPAHRHGAGRRPCSHRSRRRRQQPGTGRGPAPGGADCAAEAGSGQA